MCEKSNIKYRYFWNIDIFEISIFIENIDRSQLPKRNFILLILQFNLDYTYLQPILESLKKSPSEPSYNQPLFA
jgi:hypothetical protein